MKWCALVFALIVQCIYADKLGNEVAAVKTNFSQGHSLSSNELRQIVALAHQVGIKTVANIDTLSIHPSSKYYVRVNSAGEGKGRKITQHFLNIYRDDWLSPEARLGKGKPLARNGKFYVRDKYELFSSQFGLIKVGGADQKIVLEGETSVEAAEKILLAISAGRVEFANEEVRKKFEGMNAKNVGSVTLNGKDLNVSFNSGSHCWTIATGQFDGTQCIIGNVMTICA